MPRFFTNYWTSDTFRQNLDNEGKLLDQTAGAQFIKRGVAFGAQVYCFSIVEGLLYLIGKMQVGQIRFSNEEASALVGYQVYPGSEHLIAALATPMRFKREIPLDVAKEIRFISDNRPELKFTEAGRLDRQALRTVRELTPKSAVLLDGYLEDMRQVKLHE
jgi:hypothetical protein